MLRKKIVNYLRLGTLAFLYVSSFGCSSESWTTSQKEDFRDGCLEMAQQQMMPKADAFCDCLTQKVQTSYPNLTSVEEVEASQLQVIGLQCATEAQKNAVVWPESSQRVFLDACKSLGTEKGWKKPDTVCRCILEGVMYKFPDESDLSTINQDSLVGLQNQCVNYYEGQKNRNR